MFLANKKRWKKSLVALSAISIFGFAVAAGKVIAPEPRSHEATLLEGAHVPAEVRSIVERACQDCHSANTKWPWYAKLPPVSWQIRKDIDGGRGFMDLSKWNTYSNAQKSGYLAAIAAATQGRLMPPSKYVWMHRDARLSDTDLAALRNWTLAEQKQIRQAKRRP